MRIPNDCGLSRHSAYRVGIVSAQDAASARVRVTFSDLDQLQTWWLPVLVTKSQNDKAYHMPDIGEQVVCIMDAYDEAGIVLGAIYSSADPPPTEATTEVVSWSAKDGAAFAYNRSNHILSVNLPNNGTATISASGATIQIDGSGNVNITAAGQINLGSGSLKGVARLGDTVTCPAGIGNITSASALVRSA
jgi:phage baseplate assembly protein V